MALASHILLRLGRGAFEGYVLEKTAYFRNGALEAALYPNALLLRGTEIGDGGGRVDVEVVRLEQVPGLDVEPGHVVEQSRVAEEQVLGDGDLLLSVGCELGPVLRDGRVVVDLAAVGEDVERGGRNAAVAPGGS